MGGTHVKTWIQLVDREALGHEGFYKQEHTSWNLYATVDLGR